MIRDFEIDDLDRVMEIWLNGNMESHYFIKKEYWLKNFAYVKEMIKAANIFVYEDNHSICGFLGLSNDYIAGFFVDKRYQSKGIGKRLLDYVKDRYESLSLDVYTENERAMKFYLRENFTIIKQHIDEENDKSEVYMSWMKPTE